MPASLKELVELLDLETIEVDLYRGRQSETSPRQRVYGGQVAAQALRAACHTVEADRWVHSIHAYFLRSGDPKAPIIYDVERIRDGGSFSTRRVVARQHGKPIFYVTASFHLDEEGFEHQDRMPEVPAPDDCPTIAQLMQAAGRNSEGWEREWAALDVRFIADSRPGGEMPADEHPAQGQMWLRAAGELSDDRELNACVLTYISDLTLLGATVIPQNLVISSKKIQPASLDHAIWFHRPLRADEWLLYDQVSPSASGARGLAIGRVFAEDGTLVATVAQEGLIRPRRPDLSVG